MVKEPKDKITLLRAEEADIGDLVGSGLSELVTNPREYILDNSFWRWKYFGNPGSFSSLLIAMRNRRVVGKVGNIRMRFLIEGETATVPYMEGLSFIASERSWTKLMALLNFSFSDRRKDSPLFAYGITPRSTIDLYTRVGCISLGRIPVYSGIINGDGFLRKRGVPFPLSLFGWGLYPLVGVRYGPSATSEIIIKQLDSFEKSFDELWDAVSPMKKIAVVKDSEYLNWRYSRHPGRWYDILVGYQGEQLEGVIVFRMDKREQRAFILELMARNDDHFIMRVLLNEGFLRMKKAGIVLVTASCLEPSPVSKVFRAAGLRPLSTYFWGMQMVVETKQGKNQYPECEFSNWELTLGDWLYH